MTFDLSTWKRLARYHEERVDEDLEPGRVARQLEETHDANDAEELEKVVLSFKPRQQEVEVEGHGHHHHHHRHHHHESTIN